MGQPEWLVQGPLAQPCSFQKPQMMQNGSVKAKCWIKGGLKYTPTIDSWKSPFLFYFILFPLLLPVGASPCIRHYIHVQPRFPCSNCSPCALQSPHVQLEHGKREIGRAHV